MSIEQQRTKKQQASLQIFCRNLADQLNEAGISQKVLLENFEIDNSEESIKNLFRQIGLQKYKKKSTADLTTKECQLVYEEVNRGTSLKGVHEPWPSEEEVRYKQTKINE